ncbi:MAG: hypothetical protein PHP75_07050 [Methylacidiphilaceae bacterium]|nr:hypothetical protein [Candidatus Methylacidiphilaceae bacterium]
MRITLHKMRRPRRRSAWRFWRATGSDYELAMVPSPQTDRVFSRQTCFYWATAKPSSMPAIERLGAVLFTVGAGTGKSVSVCRMGEGGVRMEVVGRGGPGAASTR